MAKSKAGAEKVPDAGTITALPLSIEEIAQRILIVRGRRVLLDTDLAAFYGATSPLQTETRYRPLRHAPR